MNKRRVPFNDADYLSKLSREDREWYQTFTTEHYYGRQSKDPNQRIFNQEQMREAWREQNSQRRDAQWRASFDAAETAHKSVESYEELLILAIDYANSPHLPLHSETIFGELMENKRIDELQGALELISIAIEIVGDHVAVVKNSAKTIQSYNFLLAAKADVEKQISEAI